MLLEDVLKKFPHLAVDAMYITRRDDGDVAARICWVNEAFCRMYAISREAAIGMDPAKLLHWDYSDDFHAGLQEVFDARESCFQSDTLCLRGDGSSFWGGLSLVIIYDQSGDGRFGLHVLRDIDNLKNREQSAELALIENEHLLAKIEAVQARLMSAINMSPDPFGIFDARDRLVIWNPAYADTVTSHAEELKPGIKKERVLRMTLDNGFIEEAVGREEEYLAEWMAAWRSGEVAHPITRIQGRDYKEIHSQAPNGDRVILRVDISEQLRQQRELQVYAERLEQANRDISEQALHDELTGLGNRRYLNARLDELISARESSEFEIAALHIDLDRFKQINDTMGHGAGDYVLRAVAEILRSRIRKDDVVARIGGDEFIILMLCTGNSNAPEELAERVIEEVCKPIPFEDRVCRLGASVGIARTPTISPEELLTCSDIALYKAKSGGRAAAVVFDAVDLENLKSAKMLSDDILRGLEAGEFEPVFQPQVSLSNGEVVAVEVLARWRHPEKGVLAPGDFLMEAKEIHVDGQIDKMVFDKAIAEFSEISPAFEGIAPTLSFNVSLNRLMDAELLQDIVNLNFDGKIAFELVETVFLEDEQQAVAERIDALRGLGVMFEVDDFGSGRASIVGLRRIAPDRLKIDQRLIQPMTDTASTARLVRSIIEIGRALEIGVTAVGVETQAHADLLRELGCDIGQGYYFARPTTLKQLFPAQVRRSTTG